MAVKYVLCGVYATVIFFIFFFLNSEIPKKTDFLYFGDNAEKSFKQGCSRFYKKKTMEIVISGTTFTIVFRVVSNFESSAAALLRCSVKKAFLEISYISQENYCARVSFSIKLQACGLQLY